MQVVARFCAVTLLRLIKTIGRRQWILLLLCRQAQQLAHLLHECLHDHDVTRLPYGHNDVVLALGVLECDEAIQGSILQQQMQISSTSLKSYLTV